MDEVLKDIANALGETETLDAAQLDRIIRKHSKQAHDGRRVFAKKRILPYYLKLRDEGGPAWEALAINDELHKRMLRTLQMKPRRTASGVATITVITKPWPCASNCIYCPCDIRMPKSYLHDEPACQRAERCYFDPYLQTASRLNTLIQMGHSTDKVELIVLGGSFTDYPREYGAWFVSEMFRALNDSDEDRACAVQSRRDWYAGLGMRNEGDELAQLASDIQDRVNRGLCTYNAGFNELYDTPAWQRASEAQRCSFDELFRLHAVNESCNHRVVGLVMETRPDAVDADSLRFLRTLGATKLQFGIQSLDEDVLAKNGRAVSRAQIADAFSLARLFGFKTHAHFMINLLGTTPESDKAGYLELVTKPAFKPDEIKLYPCALVGGTELERRYEKGEWKPYTEEELLDVLCFAMLHTPAYTRVSRMIRDISAKDILVGNKKTNLRQLVELQLEPQSRKVLEMRFREISTGSVDPSTLSLARIDYDTATTREVFLQWVTPENRIAGFLRLSLPSNTIPQVEAIESPVGADEAMIREVHVYGFATALSQDGTSAQHHGLGKALVSEACDIARNEGYDRLNVISAVGTREYYRRLGFADNGLYLRKDLRTGDVNPPLT